MAAHIPPLSPVEPNAARLFFTEPPLQPAFMPTTTPNNDHIAAQNHDRSSEPNLPPAPPQSSGSAAVDATANHSASDPHTLPAPDPPSTNEQPRSDGDRGSEEGDGTSSGTGESEEEDEQPPADQWQPIEEDKSVPCEDELVYIQQRGEHSALDHAYWQKKIFFQLDDPELYPLDSGRIDWLIENFNGTKENPNKETVMRSTTVTIGGHEWCIKMYPRGNNSEYVSVYLECATMQGETFKESEDFSLAPLPFLDDREKLKQHASMAVQLGIIMYNPNEPRVYEYQTDAHQFTKASADYGWTRFTRYPRREFPYRMHGQRQAILRGDKLAFSAHIRIIRDPTRCMWSHGSDYYHDSLNQTGLRPFSTLTPMYGAKLPLLHFAPFREFIREKTAGQMVYWLQCLLWKMMSRTRSSNYGNPIHSVSCDAVAWLRHIAMMLKADTDPRVVNELIGTFDPDQGAAVGANKLKTKTHNSIQAAVDMHPSPIVTPALLTLELEREIFDRKERTWKKITNKVDMQNSIIVAGKTYVLYAFSTHCGDLTSNRFNLYIRPHGSEGLWYAYTDGNVTAMTHMQAVSAHSGFDTPTPPAKESRHSSSRHRRTYRFEDLNEVAHVVYYVRDDYKSALTESKFTEIWDVPDTVKHYKPPKAIYDGDLPPQTAIGPGEMNSELERELNAQIERARQNSIDASCGAATPNWIMDGEDIVMSDAAVESEAPEEDVVNPKFLFFGCTIECLGRDYYKGSMLQHKYHGEGHLIYMSGDEYIGSFVAGEKSGHGKMIYARTGNIYEGNWLQDQHHGHGTLTEAKTKNVFEGGWKHGKKHGTFVLKGEVTDEDKGCCSICYDKEINTAFYDCGHVLACRECAYKIDTCPVCRRRVVGRLELFGVKMLFE